MEGTIWSSVCSKQNQGVLLSRAWYWLNIDFAASTIDKRSEVTLRQAFHYCNHKMIAQFIFIFFLQLQLYNSVLFVAEDSRVEFGSLSARGRCPDNSLPGEAHRQYGWAVFNLVWKNCDNLSNPKAQNQALYQTKPDQGGWWQSWPIRGERAVYWQCRPHSTQL